MDEDDTELDTAGDTSDQEDSAGTLTEEEEPATAEIETDLDIESVDKVPEDAENLVDGSAVALDDVSKKEILDHEEKDEEKEPLWRFYMNSFIEKQEQKDDVSDEEGKKPTVELDLEIQPSQPTFPTNLFMTRNNMTLPNVSTNNTKILAWREMQQKLKDDTHPRDSLRSKKSRKLPPKCDCIKKNKSNKCEHQSNEDEGTIPCAEEEDDAEDGSNLEMPKDDFAILKELGYARLPLKSPEAELNLLVDRDAGETPGLVTGDYTVFELPSKSKGTRYYANVCLRGLKGMHLPELGRCREKSWKFCFYQAIVALLVKTQLRYKYAWSANVDYIYDHAWMIFVHMGSINFKAKQKLDDIVVYNYKYNIEINLVQELKDVPHVSEDVSFDYFERNYRRHVQVQRKELMWTKMEADSEKICDQQTSPVHRKTKKLEEWFDKLDEKYSNCIFRTARFSLAFWRDNFFWYLYNPYRCDESGLWDDSGYACIVKFCSKQSLKRHLMILLLRAYVYRGATNDTEAEENSKTNGGEKKEEIGSVSEEVDGSKDLMTLQIYQVVFASCKLHNEKLLERDAKSEVPVPVPVEEDDTCPLIEVEEKVSCEIDSDFEDESKVEQPDWLSLYKRTWIKVPGSKAKSSKRSGEGAKLRWHQYQVEEARNVYSLFGEIHPADKIFEADNRGKQVQACYVVCAGMTKLMAPEYWTSKTLDAIVICGDRFYSRSRMESSADDGAGSWETLLKERFSIGDTEIKVNIFPAVCGKLYSKSKKCLWQILEDTYLKYHFVILTCENTCVALFKYCGSYYLFDVNSVGSPLFPCKNAVAYIVRCTSFLKFMTVIMLTIGTSKCHRFNVNPIEIVDVTSTGENLTRANVGKCRYEVTGKLAEVICPCNEEKKELKKRAVSKNSKDS